MTTTETPGTTGPNRSSRHEPEPEVVPQIGIGAAARMLRPVRARLVGSAVLAAVAAAAGFAPFVAIAEIARAVLAAPSPASASTAVWIWAGVGATGALVRLLLLGLATHLGHTADAEMIHHLRVRIVRHLGVLPLGWFRAAGSGRVNKAMTGDLGAMHELFAHALGGMIGAAIAVLAGVGYLVSVDWRMALITVAVPLLGVTSYRVGMRSSPRHIARLVAAEGRINAASVEYADGISVVKTYGGAAGRVLDRFNKAMDDHTDAYRAFLAQNRTSSAISHVLGTELTVLAVVLAAGVTMVSAGSLTVADLLPFLVVGVGLPTSISPVFHGAHGLRMARMAAGHIDDLLNREPLPEPARPRRPDGYRIEFDRVSFSYDSVTDAVSDVSAVCEPGTITALVGPSGAGKSTLASLLPRFYDVTGGAIRVGGVDVRQLSSQTLLSSMALVFQDVMSLRDTITENIRVGRPEAPDEEVRRAAKAAQLHEVIERLPHGYETVLDETDGGGLSGGERQRLTIARALLADAPVIILDEATAALDPDNEAALQDALAELVVGRTVLVIAHRLHTIRSADQILVLDEGRLVEKGTHPELLRHGGLYARMWAAQRNGDRA